MCLTAFIGSSLYETSAYHLRRVCIPYHSHCQMVDELANLASPSDLPTDFRHIAVMHALDPGQTGTFLLQVRLQKCLCPRLLIDSEVMLHTIDCRISYCLRTSGACGGSSDLGMSSNRRFAAFV